MQKIILTIFCVVFVISIGYAQIFTQKFRGYLNEEQVSFTLTFNRENGQINGSYTNLRTGIKKPIDGAFYKQSKKKPKPSPTPPHPAYQPPLDTTNYFNLYEFDAKVKKKVRRATLVLGEEMHGNWAVVNAQGLIDLDLIREFDGKTETYQINEKTLIENTPKYQIALVYPSLSGENQKGISSFNELIERKIQANVIQFKEAALKLKVEDVYDDPNLKWDLSGIFHTKFSNDRFITLFVIIADNVLDANSKPATKTTGFTVNFDLRNQKEISLDDVFEADSEHLKAFTQVCKETFRNVGWSRYSPYNPPISLQFCEAEANNFNNWIILKDGFLFSLRPIKTPQRDIFLPNMKVSFETIKKLGGKFNKDGVLGDLF